jgi:hypothetical protein
LIIKFINKNSIAIAIYHIIVGCKAPSVVESASKVAVPNAFVTSTDTTSIQVCSGNFLLAEPAKLD